MGHFRCWIDFKLTRSLSKGTISAALVFAAFLIAPFVPKKVRSFIASTAEQDLERR